MKEEWDDKEREPRRIVQMFDPIAQADYKDWSPQLKLEWLESILKMYWSARRHNSRNTSLATSSAIASDPVWRATKR